jgi:hypothetical protein
MAGAAGALGIAVGTGGVNVVGVVDMEKRAGG